MSRLGINTGTNPNDGQGDPLRVAMGKINSNFLEIYNTFGNGSTITSYASTAGISTVAQNLTGSPRINVSGILNTGITTTEHIQVVNITSTGVITATQFKGDGSQLTNVTSTSSGVSIYDDGVLLGVARELDFDANIVSTSPDGTQRVKISATGLASAGYVAVAGYSTSSGIATNVIGGISSVTQLSVSGVSTFAGITTVTGVSLFTRQLSVSGVSTFAGITTYTASLFGTQGSFSGVVTASSFRGDGSQLTGIVAGAGGTWAVGAAGIHTTKNVGIGTIANSSYALEVNGVTSLASTSYVYNTIFFRNANGFDAFRHPYFVVQVSGDSPGWGSGIQTNMLNLEPFEVLHMAKFSRTIQIGTSFYSNSVGVPDLKRGVFLDGGTATIAVGAAITMDGKSGIITATGFVGDGSGLTGIVGSGSGIVIRDDGSTVGTAGTIDFGTGLSVSPISAGIVTVTASVGTSSQWTTVASGIYTGSNVGIGTTLPTSKLTVEGDARFSGVVTATRFESTSAGTPTIDSPNNLNINAVTVAISTDLTVGGDAYIGVNTSRGLILSSPNGTQYRLVVDNSGNLSTVLVP